MTFDEFCEEHHNIITKYNLEYEDNCDLWTLVDGFIYYHNDNQVCHITGVRYSRCGKKLIGDYSGYIDLLETTVKEKFNPNQHN